MPHRRTTVALVAPLALAALAACAPARAPQSSLAVAAPAPASLRPDGLDFVFAGGGLHLPTVLDLHLATFCATVDATQTSESHRKQCDAGSARDCYGLGVQYSCGIGVPKSFEQARGYQKRACEGGYGEACAPGGVLFLAFDPGLSMQLFRRGCEGGDNASCGSLGMLLFMGKNGEKAAPILARSCEAKSVDACANLGILLLRGMGVPPDPVRAATLNQEACEQNSSAACNTLGAQYVVGLGVTRDLAQGATLLAKACDAGLADACDNLGQALVAKEPDRAKALFKRACDGGTDAACARLTETK